MAPRASVNSAISASAFGSPAAIERADSVAATATTVVLVIDADPRTEADRRLVDRGRGARQASRRAREHDRGADGRREHEAGPDQRERDDEGEIVG